MPAEATTTAALVGVRGPSALIGEALALRIGIDPRFDAVYVGPVAPTGHHFDVIVHDATIDTAGGRVAPAPPGTHLVVVGGSQPGPHSPVEVWLPATTDPTVLVAALGDVVARAHTSRMHSNAATLNVGTGLSGRELEVGRLLAAHLNDREIAGMLGVSMTTVRSHIRRIMKKLGVTGRVDLRAAVISLGLGEEIDPDLYEVPGISPRAMLRAHVILDPGIVREAVAAALAGQPWIVTATEEDSADVSDGDLVVLTTDSAGIDLCRHLRASMPGARLLMVGQRLDPQELGSSINAGADGYISVDAPSGALITAAQRVAMGDASIPHGMLNRLLHDLTSSRQQEVQAIIRFCRLTAREQALVRLVGQERSYEEIASELVISPHTVRTHMQNILRKFGVSSRHEVRALVDEFDLVARCADAPHLPRAAPGSSG